MTEQSDTPPFERLRARGLLVQCGLAAIALVVAARFVSRSDPPAANDPGTFALFYLGVAIVLAVRMKLARLDLSRLFGRAPSRDMLQLAFVAPALAVLSIAGFWLLFLPLSYLAPNFVQHWAFDNAALLEPSTVPMWTGHFIVAVVIAPVIEEILFRGLLLQRWALAYGSPVAVVLSSAVFAVGHVELLGHFLFGVTMCALYLRTRSLCAPIAAHSLNNFLATIFTLPAVIAPESQLKDMTLASFQSQWWLGILIGAVGLGLLEVYRRRYWNGVDIAALLRGPVPYASGPAVAERDSSHPSAEG
ncbi:MAG: type II CAAX endopeptidase family protein [Gemmatimonadaceae bacterium]